MKQTQLDKMLYSVDPIEKVQKETGKNINDMHLDFVQTGTPKIPATTFFKDGNIFVNKHHRFSYMPSHTHSFIEFNYMYAGHCTEYINGEQIHLNTGDIILLDKDVIQRIDYVGESDILVNILVNDDSLITNLVNTLGQSDNLVMRFMINASKIKAIHNNYILFSTAHNDIAVNLINSLILKSQTADLNRNHIMNTLLALLLSELTRSIEQEAHDFKDETDSLPEILQYIDAHYQTTSLKTVAQHFGYNTNYLGNKIMAQVGSTFSELVVNKRLSVAKRLLVETEWPIDEIAHRVGYGSAPSLFKLFERYEHQTPSTYRHTNQSL